MTPDSDVVIIGAGMSGIGFAIQLIRKFNVRSFEIIEKTQNIGGTWLVNTYPGCGCDVPSHFYSFSFALNPNWTQKFSLRSEIQRYFHSVAKQYNLHSHIRFQNSVQTARWNESDQQWEIHIWDSLRQVSYIRRCRILISAVGSLSIPRECEIQGADSFKGSMFHSAKWDHSFSWINKDIIVLGNGCSATQFLPIVAQDANNVVQFARSPHFLAERPNPSYGTVFQAAMKYIPLAMRLYRFYLYAVMEKDFAGFDIESGAKTRDNLKAENIRYVQRTAPEKYWEALIPDHEIGCKRKVMDTNYLSSLHRDNVELIHNDPVVCITNSGVRTLSGRHVSADAIILATGFQVARMLHPMEIVGENGTSLNEYWKKNHNGAAQAYFGTCVPGFKNFFTLMGPNTLTGHLSVIYSSECQINFVLRLIQPIIQKSPRQQSLLNTSGVMSVQVTQHAARRDIEWTQTELKKLVWSSGCTSWALDPETGLNIAMYPQYQFMFWLRSIFIPSEDFEYICTTRRNRSKEQIVVGGWKWVRRSATALFALGALSIGLWRAKRLHGMELQVFCRLRESVHFIKGISIY